MIIGKVIVGSGVMTGRVIGGSGVIGGMVGV
jgi:hypothetical protein